MTSRNDASAESVSSIEVDVIWSRNMRGVRLPEPTVGFTPQRIVDAQLDVWAVVLVPIPWEFIGPPRPELVPIGRMVSREEVLVPIGLTEN